VASPDPGLVDGLASGLGLGRLAAACLVNRGHTDLSEARSFIEPRLADLSDPRGMADLERAASRGARAVVDGERVGVFGDYDADGVTSAAVVASFLAELGAPVETLVADRFGGYGLTPAAVEDLRRRGCSLIIALDCGTSDHEAARRAADLGTDLIVLDHHRVEGEPPGVAAFVNPKRLDCGFAGGSLAAVGVAFYFAAAVRRELVLEGRISREEVDPRSLLDLVAIGTVADVVELSGDNRILVAHGLRRLSETRRPGLRALLSTARVRATSLRTDHISYQLAPRLNAAGRLASAADALDLLLADGDDEARRLAERLERLTAERRALEDGILDAALRQIREGGLDEGPAILVAGEGWHRGVLGIVASRLAETFARPSAVVGFENGEGGGSARSRGQVDLYETLAASSPHLTRFGGHANAAGFSLRQSDLEAFGEAFSESAAAKWREVDDGAVVCDASVDADEIRPALVEEISRLAPFGHGNPEPLFDIGGLVVVRSRIVGSDHLKLDLETPGGPLSAFGPRLAEASGRVPPVIRVAASIGEDEWRGDGSLEIRLAAAPAPDG